MLAENPSLLNKLTVAALQLTSMGTEAVTLFFVLSGFSMAHSSLTSTGFGRFYLKRVVRIWPPYVAAAVTALLIGHLIGDEDLRHRFVQVLFYIHPGTTLTPQFWSLPYEVLFYALCPFILRNGSRVMLLALAASIATLFTLVARGPLLNPWQLFPADFLGNELLLFASGAVAYYHLDRVPVLSGRTLALTVLTLLGIIWVWKHSIGDSNMASCAMMIVVTVLLIRNLPDKVANFRPINLGYFSYSIYLFHYAWIALAVFICSRLGVNPKAITNPFGWTLLVLPVLGICFLLYLATERLSNRAVSKLRRGSANRQ